MPNIKSAIKRVKTIETKTNENAMIKTAYKTAIKNFMSEVESGNKEKIAASYKVAVKAIEKAATKGVIKDNTAARKKSSLAKVLNAAK
ncbi:MAG: 30S ribosomal protein S20 [Clostridia bacterium]|nr:30S ribosomal protein S20 [Clostridia bacterium]